MTIELLPGDSRELNVALLPITIPVAIAAHSTARRTVYWASEAPAMWLEAWSASEGDDLMRSHSSFPAGWWYPPWPNVGVRREILFFDTTGMTGNMSLHLRNNKARYPCYFGNGDLFIVSGNGADPDFGPEIYGWMRTRFSSSYFIAMKPISETWCQSVAVFPIPQQFINPAGYTVLICVLGYDFTCASTVGGSHGSYFGGDNARLTMEA